MQVSRFGAAGVAPVFSQSIDDTGHRAKQWAKAIFSSNGSIVKFSQVDAFGMIGATDSLRTGWSQS